MLPHVKDDSFYGKVLAGDYSLCVPLLALEDKEQVVKDMDVAVLLALPGGMVSEGSVDGENRSASSDGDQTPAPDRPEEEEPEPVPVGIPGVPPTDIGVDVGIPGEADIDDSMEHVFDRLSSGAFRHFKITPKQYEESYGGYQATCLFHKKNHKTGCKRWFRVDGPSRKDKEDAVKLLLHWCIIAPDFDRQRAHLYCPMSLADCPDVATMMALEPTDERPVGVRKNVELDAEAGVAVRGRGRGRGRASGAAGDGRGKGGRSRGRGAENDHVVAASGSGIASSSSNC